MFFKLELNANLDITNFGAGKKSVTFSFRDIDKTVVVIRKSTLKEQKIGHGKDQIFCMARLRREPNDEILEMFEYLANNKMPKGIKKPKSSDSYFSRYFDEENNIKENHILPLDLMPQTFKEFQSGVREKLSDYIKRTIKVLRWRTTLEGKHNPIQSSRGFFWSFDKKNWRRMPYVGYVKISQHSASPITREIKSEIQKMVAKGEDEPLGHMLFREAWKQKEQNSRSALILGIVAIEVGFKQCVGTLLPQAQWLVENVPSPPITKMLSNFLPQLSTILDINGKVLPPPKSVMRLLQDGIEQRNKIVHVGSLFPKEDDLEDLLLAIRDTLYLLDYYCGNKWALNKIQTETLDALLIR
jgi:hypothetical protein